MVESTPRSTSRSRFAVLAVVLFLAVAALFSQFISPRVQAVSTTIVISQVYGGGGNTGATYKNDFIEIFNPTSGSISVNGWSVQMAGASGGGSWSGTNLPNATIPSGGYFLVQEAGNNNGILNLPGPDATGSIDMPATAGRVALVNTTALLSVEPHQKPLGRPTVAPDEGC